VEALDVLDAGDLEDAPVLLAAREHRAQRRILPRALLGALIPGSRDLLVRGGERAPFGCKVARTGVGAGDASHARSQPEANPHFRRALTVDPRISARLVRD